MTDSTPHSTPEWPDKPLTTHRVYQLVNGRQEDERTVIDLMAALRSLEEQLESAQRKAERRTQVADRLLAENRRLHGALQRIADAPWKSATVTGEIARKALENTKEEA